MQPQGRRWFVTLSFSLALAWLASPTWTEEKHPSGGEVAVVNGSVITQEDFEDEMARVQQMFLNRGTPLSDSQLPRIKREVLESLISRELLYQESQKRGIDVGESAVDEQLSKLKKRFPSEAEFNRALGQMNLSEAAVKSQIRRGMAIQRLIDEQFAGEVNISEKESKAYYDSHPSLFKQPEEVRASHILIKVDPQADESQRTKARQEIEKIQERLKKGEDFAALARKHSECPSSVKGGDLNYFRRGQMVKPFEDTAFALETSEVSGIVETRFGYHLIKVTDKKPETTIAYKDIKGKIEEGLKQEKVQKETRRYVAKLKEKADVKRFLEMEP